jgi:hypothetical protein
MSYSWYVKKIYVHETAPQNFIMSLDLLNGRKVHYPNDSAKSLRKGMKSCQLPCNISNSYGRQGYESADVFLVYNKQYVPIINKILYDHGFLQKEDIL